MTRELSRYSAGIRSAGVLRTHDAAQWRASVVQLIALADLVLMDMRHATPNTLEEATLLLRYGVLEKTLFIAHADGALDALNELGSARTRVAPDHVVTEEVAIAWSAKGIAAWRDRVDSSVPHRRRLRGV